MCEQDTDAYNRDKLNSPESVVALHHIAIQRRNTWRHTRLCPICRSHTTLTSQVWAPNSQKLLPKWQPKWGHGFLLQPSFSQAQHRPAPWWVTRNLHIPALSYHAWCFISWWHLHWAAEVTASVPVSTFIKGQTFPLPCWLFREKCSTLFLFQPVIAETWLSGPGLSPHRQVCCKRLHELAQILPLTLPLVGEKSPNHKFSHKLPPQHLSGWWELSAQLTAWPQEGIGGAGADCSSCLLCHQGWVPGFYKWGEKWAAAEGREYSTTLLHGGFNYCSLLQLVNGRRCRALVQWPNLPSSWQGQMPGSFWENGTKIPVMDLCLIFPHFIV